LAAEAVRVWSIGIYGGQSGAGVGFLRVIRFSLPVFIPQNSPSSQSPGTSTIGQNGQRTEWTQFELCPHYADLIRTTNLSYLLDTYLIRSRRTVPAFAWLRRGKDSCKPSTRPGSKLLPSVHKCKQSPCTVTLCAMGNYRYIYRAFMKSFYNIKIYYKGSTSFYGVMSKIPCIEQRYGTSLI
jgi:hypothetical protein